MMKKYLVVAVMVAALMMAGCGDDPNNHDPNKGEPQFVDEFKKAKFSPDVEDVAPGAALGGASSGRSLRSSGNTREARNLQSQEGVITIPASDLVSTDTIEWLLNCIQGAKDSEAFYKEIAFEAIVDFYDYYDSDSEIPTNEWVSVSGDRRFMHEVTEEASTIHFEGGDYSIKFSMYIDGTNEMYVQSFDYFNETRYSRFNGEQYTLFSKSNNDGFRYLEFDEIDGMKTGVVAWGGRDDPDHPYGIEGRDQYYAYVFEGTDDAMKQWHSQGETLPPHGTFSGAEFAYLRPDYFFKIGGGDKPVVVFDARSLNIAAVTAEKPANEPRHEVLEFILDDDSRVPGRLWREERQLVYEMTLQEMFDGWGKFLNIFAFHGGAFTGDTENIKELTSSNEFLEHWAPGLRSVEDFNMAEMNQEATEAIEHLYSPFDTFNDVPLNIHNADLLRERIAEIISEYETGFEDR